jgi:hypothetical protein
MRMRFRALRSLGSPGLSAFTPRQLRERYRDLLAATDRMDAERASCIVTHARLETAADRGRRRDELRQAGREGLRND